ncbi:hypothetical protein PHMEG_00022661 [Phytophthora megakarya]|uniref:Uncharacterized protein n=1 Tax=Phytophthora megakarya TaxID=4795 RepID=A0A225VL71_9STRA|nr:hypothetical protein PHMEG_00022661 [Phytophthora megakarya]
MYEGVFAAVSYFAIEYTSNWNFHLEDLGALIPVRLYTIVAIKRSFANAEVVRTTVVRQLPRLSPTTSHIFTLWFILA